MPSANKTKNLGLPQWAGNEYMKRKDWNDAFKAIDDAMTQSFDDLMKKYGIEKPVKSMNEAGQKTITVTIKNTAPVVANQVATFSSTEAGEKMVTIVTTIDGQMTTETYPVGMTREGGVNNG